MRRRFSEAFENLRLSPIVQISERARAEEQQFLERTGECFVYFQRGDLNFPTPEYIVNGAKTALAAGKTKYPKSGGEDDFKDAILRKLCKSNNTEGLTRENVICTMGGQEGIELSFKLFEEQRGTGFSPCWPCVLEDVVPYTRVNFSQIPLNEDFSINFGRLEQELEKGISFLYFNNPHNPTGKVFSEEEVRKVVELCTKKEVYLISDEAYERLIFNGERHFSIASLNLENIITAFTFSKTYAMTGWRVGYVVARDKKVVELLKLGQYTQTAGVPTFLQYAGKEALDNKAEEEKAVAGMVGEFQRRRDALYNGLKGIDGLKVVKPDGAFYVFPDFSNFIPSELDGAQRGSYIHKLLWQEGVITVPGSVFGEGFENHVRLSFSGTPIDAIEDGVQRIRKALKK